MSESNASEAEKRTFRLAPPFWFRAEDGVIHVCINSKGCVTPHHGDLEIEAAEVARAMLDEAIASAKAQKAKRVGRSSTTAPVVPRETTEPVAPAEKSS